MTLNVKATSQSGGSLPIFVILYAQGGGYMFVICFE